MNDPYVEKPEDLLGTEIQFKVKIAAAKLNGLFRIGRECEQHMPFLGLQASGIM